MKMHSFFAECTWMAQDKDKMKQMNVYHLLYFLFAPTLVFRLSYPRLERRSWSRVAAYGVQFLLVIVVSFMTIPNYLQKNFKDYGADNAIDRKRIIHLVLVTSVLGAVSVFSVFYGILHCWLNIWAELLRFADRGFYDKWWQLDSYSRYYRQWNLVVHDWLHNYCYREAIIRTNGNRQSAAILTFLISAVFHEYIITLALGFYYPVLFISFAGFGMFFFFVSLYFRRGAEIYGNIFLFFSIILGWSVQIVLYAVEHYSRNNCPQSKVSVDSR